MRRGHIVGVDLSPPKEIAPRPPAKRAEKPTSKPTKEKGQIKDDKTHNHGKTAR